MAGRLDLGKLKESSECIRIGVLRKKIIDLLGLNRDECDIVFWPDRVKHIEKHKKDFESEKQFYECMSRIPEIIESPDYVGRHPSTGSLEYIKRIDRLMLVAVRIRHSGSPVFRTAYPISEEQLQSYLRSGTVYEV